MAKKARAKRTRRPAEKFGFMVFSPDDERSPDGYYVSVYPVEGKPGIPFPSRESAIAGIKSVVADGTNISTALLVQVKAIYQPAVVSVKTQVALNAYVSPEEKNREYEEGEALESRDDGNPAEDEGEDA